MDMLHFPQYFLRETFPFWLSRCVMAEKNNFKKQVMTAKRSYRRAHQRLQLCGERRLRFAQYHVFNCL